MPPRCSSPCSGRRDLTIAAATATNGLGLLASIGVGTLAGIALFGAAGLLVALAAAMVMIRRRNRGRDACRTAGTETVAVELGVKRLPSSQVPPSAADRVAMALEAMAAAQLRITQLQAQLGITSVPRSQAPRVARSFDASFASAVAEVGPTGDAKAVLGAYGNGQLPSDVLVPIGNGKKRLWGPAATSFNRMASAAWQAGIDLKVNDGYRPLADQERLADELGLYSQGGKAATPGTSTHGWGVSVDVDTGGGAVGWLRANAAQFGFAEDVAREPWHWTWESRN